MSGGLIRSGGPRSKLKPLQPFRLGTAILHIVFAETDHAMPAILKRFATVAVLLTATVVLLSMSN